MKRKLEVLFWLVGFLGMIAFFSKYFDNITICVYFILMLFPVAITTSYVFNLIIVPRYLLQKKYVLFCLYMVYLIIASLYLESIVITLSFVFLGDYSFQNVSQTTSDVFFMTMSIYFIVFLFSFIKLIQSMLKSQDLINNLEDTAKKNKKEVIQVRSNRKLINIPLDNLLFIESLGDYIKFHLEDEKVINSRNKISKIEEDLPSNFVRIHRSFIVNKFKITSYNKQFVYINYREFNISRTYKTKALEVL